MPIFAEGVGTRMKIAEISNRRPGREISGFSRPQDGLFQRTMFIAPNTVSASIKPANECMEPMKGYGLLDGMKEGMV